MNVFGGKILRKILYYVVYVVDDGGELVGRDVIIDRNVRFDVIVKYEGERECKKKCKFVVLKV